jgi:hypothetical protein
MLQEATSRLLFYTNVCQSGDISAAELQRRKSLCHLVNATPVV